MTRHLIQLISFLVLLATYVTTVLQQTYHGLATGLPNVRFRRRAAAVSLDPLDWKIEAHIHQTQKLWLQNMLKGVWLVFGQATSLGVDGVATTGFKVSTVRQPMV